MSEAANMTLLPFFLNIFPILPIVVVFPTPVSYTHLTLPTTGIVMTKLDGTAKGGILLALAKKYKIPIIALGLGEKEDDLQLFEAEKFAEAFTQIN